MSSDWVYDAYPGSEVRVICPDNQKNKFTAEKELTDPYVHEVSSSIHEILEFLHYLFSGALLIFLHADLLSAIYEELNKEAFYLFL